MNTNENQELYNKAEAIGRDLFAEFLIQNDITDYMFEPIESPVDLKFKDKNKKRWVVEIKVRNITCKDYNLHMIERSKHRELLWVGDSPIYANFFGTEYLYLYGEEAIRDYTIETVYRPRKTVDKSKGYEKSETYFVNSKYAKKYKLDENGKWVNYK